MKTSKVYVVILLLNAAAFGFFGLKWLVNPIGMSAPLGITLTNADAITDAQAVYGGLELGLGIFLVICALRRPFLQAGLLAATLALGGLGLARLTGILTGAGHVTGATYQLLGTDLTGLLLNLVCFLAFTFAQRATTPTAVIGKSE